MAQPEQVCLWLPREDEHALAASLGMVDPDRDLCRQMIERGQEQVARDLPGVPVRVYQWHVWEVVRQMHEIGVTNTPDGRAAAYGYLSGQQEQ